MDDDETQELVRRLFYLLTARLEDAAGAAADEQGASRDPSVQALLAQRLCSAGEEVAILARAAHEIARVVNEKRVHLGQREPGCQACRS